MRTLYTIVIESTIVFWLLLRQSIVLFFQSQFSRIDITYCNTIEMCMY